jgi:hypothetical protein
MKNYTPDFGYEKTMENHIVIFDNRNLITEIRNISLLNTKFIPNGQIIIGEDYPLPLYWQQYSNHEDPERNAGILLSMNIDCKPEKITINIKSRNGSGSITSQYDLSIIYDSILESYVYSVDACLIINSEWLVTYNPTHGEVEFLNFYPDKTFVKQKELKNKYDYFIYESVDNKLVSLPHVHFDLEVYRNINLRDDGIFYYLLEDENPVVQLIGATAGVTDIGVCSYMWDTHFGIRICSNEEKNTKLNKNVYNASYKLFSIPRENAVKLLVNSNPADILEIKNFPILHEGVNTFDKSALDYKDKQRYWSFQTETIIPDGSTKGEAVASYFIDRNMGFSDNNSLAIKTNDYCVARWIYTSFGPEFRGDDLPIGKRIRITCMGKIPEPKNQECMRIGIRIRKTLPEENESKFIIYFSQDVMQINDWEKLICITPKLDFDFDRIHLLLEFSGIGECRFDDLEYEIIDDLTESIFKLIDS